MASTTSSTGRRPRLTVGAPGRPAHRFLALLVAAAVTASLLGGCGNSSTGSTSNGTTAAPAATSGGGNGADPGTCPTSNTTAFAKTKFVAHAGLAFGAFRRYLYRPFKAGGLSPGAHGRLLALVKAAAAALFIEHEVRLAAADVEANPTLCKLIAAPLRSFYSTISGLAGRIRGGDTSGVDDAQSQLAQVGSASSSQGVPIQENEAVGV